MNGDAGTEAAERPKSQLFVQQEGRKPLFSSANTSQASHVSQVESSIFSPDTRIPQPGATTFSGRKPLSLSEAYRLAASDDDTGELHNPIDGSPSPAPRPWRQAREADQIKLRQHFGEDHIDSKSRMQQLKDNNQPPADARGLSESPMKKSSPAKRPSESARDLVEATGNEGSSWRNGANFGERITSGSTLPDLVPGIEDIAIPSVESPAGRRSTNANASPEKSFAWQIDEDFTAGDVQVSDSPRLKTTKQLFESRLPFDENAHIDINSRSRINNPGSRNTKLDEIRSREVKAGNNIPFQRPPSRPLNTKLDDIRTREAETESSIPIPDRRLSGTRNTKLEEIRQREIEGLSKRQIASSRLEEIRDKNFNSRPSMSPETRPRPASRMSESKKSINGEPEKKKIASPDSEKKTSPKSPYGGNGERVPDTPVTVYKGPRERTSSLALAGVPSPLSESKRPDLSHRRTDSKDLLRQLARATSSSPMPDPEAKKTSPTGKLIETSPPLRSPRRGVLAPTNSSIMRSKVNREKKAGRPTVEFAGLRRVRAESSGSKRSVNSEADPTDRLQAEAKLFELRDDMSEKGSVRGPSPAVKDTEDEDDVEATPKAKKEWEDPLTMPTPKVTGAYVETPATAKVERIDHTEMSTFEEGIDAKLAKLREERANLAKGIIHDDTASEAEEKAIVVRRTRDDDTASDPGSDSKDRTSTTSASLRRRAQSLPRRRLPPKNTAKVPSVKSDLKELQRTYNIDDSTLDDLEDILSGRKAPTSQMEALMEKMPESTDDDSFDLKIEQNYKEQQAKVEEKKPQPREKSRQRESAENEMAAYDRMSKSLTTSLLGIRDAKKGMERLEDNLAQHENKPVKVETEEKVETETKYTETHIHHHHENCSAPDSSVTYVQLPLPKLYRRKPNFNLTPLGIITLIIGLWYVIEAGMCAMYCSPISCSSAPCIWSYDDPTWGSALPVKLDQWITGGAGRKVFNNVAEEAEDLIADAMDAVYGRRITDVNVDLLSFDDKRKHRRRLRKKGLEKKIQLDASPETRARWEAWRKERIAREKAREARTMGYTVPNDADPSVGGDQRVW